MPRTLRPGSGQGLKAAQVTNIPAQWDANWFRSFITTHMNPYALQGIQGQQAATPPTMTVAVNSPLQGTQVLTLTAGTTQSTWAPTQTVHLPDAVAFDVEANGGLVDLLFGTSGAWGNGYIIRFDARAGFVAGQILKMTAGVWTNIGTTVAAANSAALGGTYRLVAVMGLNGAMKVYVDGELQCTATDTTYTLNGSTYMATEAISNTTVWAPSAIDGTLDMAADGVQFVHLASDHASNNVAYNFRGVYSAGNAYVKGDEVVYGQTYWLAVNPSTGSTPSTANANWQAVASYNAFQGAWSAVTNYVIGDEVTYSGNYWVCTVANTNSAPTTSNANWQIAGPATLDNVANGTTRFAVGTMGNLLNTTSWVHLTSGSQGNFIDTATNGHVLPSKMFLGGDAGGLPLGPYGYSEPMWVGYGAATGGIYDGGWENSGDLKGIDPTKTYRASVWVCKVVGSTGGQIYFGCDTSYTDNVGGGANPNPYFTSFNVSAMAVGQWYLLVGIIHGAGYTGASSGLSGVWDAALGRITTAGTDFQCAAGAPQQTHRVFLYNDTSGADNTTTDWVVFAHPRFEIVDGSEPTIQALLANTMDGFRDGGTFLRMPSPPSVSAQANTALTQSGTTKTINVNAGTFYLGNIVLNYSSGSVTPATYGKWYVYFDNPGYTGGAVTFQATTDPLVTSQAPGRFYVGTITTASGGGGGGGSGGGVGCCLHESQMIELADGREIPARELTTDMILLSHEGPTPITELRFLPHREWFKVRLDNGVELFVAGDHRFLDDDFNQIRTWDLKLQQRVRARNGYAIVTGLDILWKESTKVAIEVGEPHTYYVQGILSHNKQLC